jgi:hypothetical protein
MLIAFPHGAESLALNKDTAKRLAAFERKVLKRMFGGIKVNEYWRKLYNRELMRLLFYQKKSVELDLSC